MKTLELRVEQCGNQVMYFRVVEFKTEDEATKYTEHAATLARIEMEQQGEPFKYVSIGDIGVSDEQHS